jgi:hypothetical protein
MEPAVAKTKPLEPGADAPAGASVDAPAGGDTTQGVAQSPAPEALPQGGGRYTRTPAGDLVRVQAEQETQPASDGKNVKEQA